RQRRLSHITKIQTREGTATHLPDNGRIPQILYRSLQSKIPGISGDRITKNHTKDSIPATTYHEDPERSRGGRVRGTHYVMELQAALKSTKLSKPR
ncbi:Hypothetical predicted protein, partial [Pelobates cultripes]